MEDIANSETKTDSVNARTLAHLLRTGFVPESYIPPKDIRGLSDKTPARVIEDIAEPQPIEVTEYKVNHYKCVGCGKEVVAGHEICR